MAASIVLILGAGANIGSNVAQRFAKAGYKVALASRSIKDEVAKTADVAIKADFSSPESVKSVFDEVKSKLGVPSVVIYNGSSSPMSQASIGCPLSLEQRPRPGGLQRTCLILRWPISFMTYR
jgi:NAD(P)-dependent dehydrogenase (short-subunit alcohol dehydrogenase family)